MSVDIRFEWDESKSILNLLKHGVTFDDAQYVFLDKDLVVAAGYWRKGKMIYEEKNQI